ncbi:hypothetical protein [Hyphomicrobium sp. DY-1]|uniref:hypothetical protein n=1 Tax=Hyphomicrobium sp. DY-1 TaxID=3075650 RepID=UPI0039C385F8
MSAIVTSVILPGMTTTTPAFETLYRSYFAQTADPVTGFDDWMIINRHTFQALNPHTAPADYIGAFHIFMVETYEGQLPRA